MNNYVFRPLLVVIGIVIIILIARIFIVPKDFGVGEQGYMYGWHRNSNEDEWKAFEIKYKFDNEYCKDCHRDKYISISQTPHTIINCENCHGPAMDHPSNPLKLQIDKSREQCLRCHLFLPYSTSGRAKIVGIDLNKHNVDIECSVCHNPHNPKLEGVR